MFAQFRPRKLHCYFHNTANTPGLSLGTINGALSTPGYFLALLRKLSYVSWGLTDIAETKQVWKTNLTLFCTRSTKKGPKSDPHVSTQDPVDFVFKGSLSRKRLGERLYVGVGLDALLLCLFVNLSLFSTWARERDSPAKRPKSDVCAAKTFSPDFACKICRSQCSFVLIVTRYPAIYCIF